MKYNDVLILVLLMSLIACNEEKKEQPNLPLQFEEKWMLGFKKTDINPILIADSTFVFNDPITKQEVKWQKADVFNPGAIVRNDTVFMLFRAEDNPAAILGGRTSRIGLAHSTDGIHFTKYPEPVFLSFGG